MVPGESHFKMDNAKEDTYTIKKTEAWDCNWQKTVWEPPWSADSDLNLSLNLWFIFNLQIGLVQYLQIDPKCWDRIWAHLSLGPKLFVVEMFMYILSFWWKIF
jgi:hypothetical protein